MKVQVFIFALVILGCSVAQGQKLFHEHFDDFGALIVEEAGEELELIAQQYLQFDEFMTTVNYLMTKNFRDLVYEMESLPEFQAVVDFLERDNIDILFFIDLLNEAIDSIDSTKLKRNLVRQSVSGTDFNSYINDITKAFPKDKLSALYDQKMEEDDVFRLAMENLYSDEWNELFGALWDSDIFQNEVRILADNGIDINVLIREIMAIFGQA